MGVVHSHYKDYKEEWGLIHACLSASWEWERHKNWNITFPRTSYGAFTLLDSDLDKVSVPTISLSIPVEPISESEAEYESESHFYSWSVTIKF